MSSESRGEDVELKAVTGVDAASGVPHGAQLVAFADANVRGDEAAISTARAALADAMGPEAVVDAAGVVGNFERMVRIADGTGIPLDKPIAIFSVDLRHELGIDGFGAAANTPPVSGLLRGIGRIAQPLVRVIMSRYSSR